MRVLFCLVIVCLAAVSYASLLSRIVGGESAKISEIPYVVSLRWNNEYFCGGSIITQRYILTAAHCVQAFVNSSLISNLSVHTGTNFLNETGDAYEVEKVITHANYVSFFNNDIGLLHLKKNIAFKETVRPITLAATNHLVETNDSCLLSGWGRLKYKGPVSNDLQILNLRVFSQTKCKLIFWQVLDSHICTFSRYGQGACNGDSGSPLVFNDVQIGIASFVWPCAVGYPDVYTRVSAFKEWIDEHTKS